MSQLSAARVNEVPEQGTKPRILIVDDEPSMRDMLRIILRRDGFDVVLAANGREAIAILEGERVDLLLSDIRMPDIGGVDVLRAAKALNRDIIAFMMTAFASTDSAVEAMRLGAVDYFTKPFNMDELRLKVRQHIEALRLKQENVLLKRALNSSHEFCNIIGRSDAMLAVFKMVETIAKTNSTILITGESGTGKDLVARAVHYNSLRREHPFVALNCGALPETLLEDEIGEMSPTMQVKLLRVLQDRRFRRLGGTEEVQADIRVIAATNQDLQKMVAENRFREDLYYRINVIHLDLPPLRERREDVPLLADHFLAKYSEGIETPVRSISHEAMDVLSAYDWPGNVRELENALERAVALEQTQVVLPESLPAQVRARSSKRVGAQDGPVGQQSVGMPELKEGFDLEALGEEFYRHYIALALERTGGVQTKAAEMLGMSFRSFRYYAKKFNLR
jgi:two-component system response regulator PilR (NtrC family)